MSKKAPTPTKLTDDEERALDRSKVGVLEVEPDVEGQDPGLSYRVECPWCGKIGRLPSDWYEQGNDDYRYVQCPDCGRAFRV